MNLPMNLLYWLDPWEPSPTVVVAILVAAILFVRGVRHARVSALRQVSFWFGLVALYIALHTRLDYFFEHEFFMHRLQHLVLHHLGPFFIAWSYPGAALRAGKPAWSVKSLPSQPVRQPQGPRAGAAGAPAIARSRATRSSV